MKEKAANMPNLVLQWTISGIPSRARLQKLPWGWYLLLSLPAKQDIKIQNPDLNVSEEPADPNAIFSEP